MACILTNEGLIRHPKPNTSDLMLPSTLRAMMLDIHPVLDSSGARAKIINDTLIRWWDMKAMGQPFPSEFEDAKSFLSEEQQKPYSIAQLILEYGVFTCACFIGISGV